MSKGTESNNKKDGMVKVRRPEPLDQLGLRPGDIVPPDTPPASSVSGSSSRYSHSRSASHSSGHSVAGDNSSSSARHSWSSVDSDAAAAAATVPSSIPTAPVSAPATITAHVVPYHHSTKPRRSQLTRTNSLAQETILEESPSCERVISRWQSLRPDERAAAAAEEDDARMASPPSVPMTFVPQPVFDEGAVDGNDAHHRITFVKFEREATAELIRSHTLFPDTEKSSFYAEGERQSPNASRSC
jgi:hypothetical protein